MNKRVNKLVLVLLAAVFALFVTGCNYQDQAKVRTVELSKGSIDYQSILNEFEDAVLTKDGDTTSFEGYKTLDASFLEELDNLSETDVQEMQDTRVKYNFTYNQETNIVTIYAELKNALGELEIDTLSGVGFINDKGEIDAVMNVDDESVLLSEMQEAGMIQNCGWFKRVAKKVVKHAVQAVVVATVAVATAAVVVATAGAAAPALVAVGVGVTTAAQIGIGVGAVAGALYFATIGKAALQAGTAFSEKIADGAEYIIDKVSNAILTIICKCVEYEMQLVTDSVLSEMQLGEYRFVAFTPRNIVAYITKLPVSYNLAVWGLRIGLNTYSSQSNAYRAALDAGDGEKPRENGYHDSERGIYFRHYHVHRYSILPAFNPKKPITTGHACFGMPKVVL
ncbi:MAG: hypothetical protein K2L51_01920 [Clostridiales bacterium]|nr:hypothetical protein [Clostridiales bacterium]